MGSPVSADCWKTSHRREGLEEERRRGRGISFRGDRI
jgi:hypothetical protein